jgi:hypothetical protein
VSNSDSGRDAPLRDPLRLLLATLAYRARKALVGAPAGFGSVRASAATRTALETLAHLGDLMEWSISLARDGHEWKEPPRGSWDDEVRRFFAGTAALDAELASRPVSENAEIKLIQGPLADALTHVGQINVLRRIGGAPVRGENYAQAKITVGRAGMDQPAPVREFD